MNITNEKFWSEAQERVIQVLHEMGFVHEDEIATRILNDRSFVCGLVDGNPTDVEIAKAIEKYIAD